MANRKREPEAAMKVISRFLYNPEKAERGLKAMADIQAGALRRSDLEKVEVGPRSDIEDLGSFYSRLAKPGRPAFRAGRSGVVST